MINFFYYFGDIKLTKIKLVSIYIILTYIVYNGELKNTNSNILSFYSISWLYFSNWYFSFNLI